MNTLERFWKWVEINNRCWNWTGALSPDGYGQFWNGKRVRAHRYAYETFIGPIPEELECDHLCRNRACVNPAHIELVTSSVNSLRGLAPAMIKQFHLSKTHCPHGHAYDEGNTYIAPNGGRECRTCRRKQRIEWREREKVRERE